MAFQSKGRNRGAHSHLRCGKRGEAVESGRGAGGVWESKSLPLKSFGADLTEWNRKAEKEARSGKLSAAGANVPRGTIAASGD